MSTNINVDKLYTNYDSTIWRNEETLIDAERLNKIEEAIKQLQRGESILVGTVNPQRLPNATFNSSAPTTQVPGAMGIVQLYNDWQGKAELSAGWAVTPKALNDLYKNSASTTNTTDRIAVKAETAIQLEKNVKIKLIGDATTGEIIFDRGSDDVIQVEVTVPGDEHTHGLGQLVDCEATTSNIGLTQLVARESDIGSNLRAEANLVPNAFLFKQVVTELRNTDSNQSKAITNLNGYVDNIKSLNETYLANTPLLLLQTQNKEVFDWYKKFSATDGAFATVLDSTTVNTNGLKTLNDSVSNLISTKIPQIESTASSLSRRVTTVTAEVEDLNKKIKIYEKAFELLAQHTKYIGDILSDAERLV